jgi:hypothetical protein
MEQRNLPSAEDSPRLSSPHTLSSETGQSVKTLLHAADPTFEPDQVEVLGAALSRMAQRNQKCVGRAIWITPVTYAVATVLVLSGNYLLGNEHATALITAPLFYLPVLLLWAGSVSFNVISVIKLRKQCRQRVQVVADLDDVRAIGPLIDTWKLEDGATQKISNQALIDLLPRLQPGDAHLMNTEQRAVLCRILSRGPRGTGGNSSEASQPSLERKVEMRIAILKAFAQVGDSSTLPIVQRLVHGEAKTTAKQRIQTEAQACLTALELRIEQARNPQTLLRASNAFDASAETLLRAAKGGQVTAPEQLLRPDPHTYER